MTNRMRFSISVYLCLLNYVRFSVCSRPQMVFERHTGYRMPEGYSDHRAMSVVECSVKCLQDAQCLSASFQATMDKCELHSTSYIDTLSELIASDGWELLNLLTGTKDGWTVYGTSEYKVVEGLLSWQDAKVNCESMNAHLAYVNNEDDDTFLVSLVSAFAGTWLGATDSEEEGVWRWLDGSSLVYTNWGGTEPNNSGGNEHCLMMYSPHDHQWNDNDCEHAYQSICQRSL